MKKTFKLLLTVLFIFIPLYVYAEGEVSEGNEVVSEQITLTANVVKGNNNSLVVSWDAKEGATNYLVYRSTKEKSGFKKIKTVTTNTITDKSLTYGSTYYYKVVAVFEESKVTSNVVHAKVKPNKVEGVTATGGNKYIKVAYKKVSVTGYQIQRSTDNVKWTTVKTIYSYKTLSYKNTGLSTNKTYYYKVRAFKTVRGKKVYGSWSEVVSTKTAPGTPKYSVKATSFDEITISVTALKGATTYKIYRSTSKYKNFKHIGDADDEDLVYVDDTVTPKTTYYYKVRGCNENGKCGSYGSVYSTKTSIKTPTLKMHTTVYNNLSWTEVPYRTKYQVYASSSKNGTYSKIAEVDENSFKDETLKLNKKRYYKVRYYVDYKGKKYYSSYSNVVSGAPTIETVHGISVEAVGTSIRVDFAIVEDVDGYLIGMSETEDGLYNMTNKNASEYNNMLEMDSIYIDGEEFTTYYIKVYAYIWIDGNQVTGKSSFIYTITTGSRVPEEYEAVMEAAESELPNIYGRVDLAWALLDAGFTEDEAEFAVAYVLQDWSEIATRFVNLLFEEDKYSREDMEYFLADEGYTEDEIVGALAGINFKYIALSKIREERYKYYSEAKLRALLEERLFTEEEIDYAISKITNDFTNVAYAFGLSVHLHYSIDEIRQMLVEAEFTEAQIDAAISRLEEDGYSFKYLTRKIEGAITVGDKVSIGGETFYVVKATADVTTFLAKDPLVVGPGASSKSNFEMQGYATNDDGSAIGRIKFANTNYWHNTATDNISSDYADSYPAVVYDSNSNLEKYVQQYVTLIRNLNIFGPMNGRLLKVDELVGLGCTVDLASGQGNCNNAPSWLTNMQEGTTIWLGDAASKNNIYTLSGKTVSTDYYTSNHSVRPVIDVPTMDVPGENQFSNTGNQIAKEDVISLNGEEFYVVSSDENKTVLFAKYALKVNNNAQASSGAYQTAFSTTDYWKDAVGEGLAYPGDYDSNTEEPYPYVYDSNSLLYSYVEAYANKISEDNGNISVEGRLLSYEEARTLSATTLSGTLDYWLGSAVEQGENNTVWCITPNGNAYSINNGSPISITKNIRPVIVVNTSDLLN